MRKIDVVAAIVQASLDGIYVSAYAEDGRAPLLKGLQESMKDYSHCPEIDSLVRIDGYFSIDKFMELIEQLQAKDSLLKASKFAHKPETSIRS